MVRRNAALWFLVVLTSAVAVAALALPPLSQPPEYHQFADQRALLGIPNFFNVSSSIAFLLVGGAGVVLCLRDLVSTSIATAPGPVRSLDVPGPDSLRWR